MTEPLFKFDPILPAWIIATVIGVIVTTLIWLELKKTYRFRFLRIACVIALMLSFIAILMQPKVRKQDSQISILLTENYDTKIVDSLISVYPGAQLLNLAPATAYRESQTILFVNNIPTERVDLIVGDGLTTSGIDVFANKTFASIVNAHPEGITDLTFPKIAQAQARNVITGVFNNGNDSTKIILEGPGGKEDSVIIDKNGPSVFSLSFTPKQAGNFTYSVSVDGKKENLPLTVESEKQMNILIIQMFPTFEAGYLKNLLAKNHSLVLRYQLSKNNFRYEYINHRPIATNRLTSDLLKDFDLVIIDSDAATNLSGAERKNISESMLSGLGVLVLFNETPRSKTTLNSLLPITFKPYEKDTAKFFLGKEFTLPAWPTQPVANGEIISTFANENRILAGYVYQGFGKSGFQIFQQTYTLALEGDSLSYSNLWKTILQKNARTPVSNYRIALKNEFPVFANEPIEIEIISSSPELPTLLHDGIEIPVAEDAVIDDLWITKVWPGKSGWHELQIKGDSTKQHYYVSESGSWKSLATSNAIRNTKKLASANQLKTQTGWVYEPFGKWIFYALFILAAAVLWLIPKL